ncbi:MAG: GNAT family N-acetyltransferase [Porphyromonadaceae bacterium]|nr:GNAT family N-acetyltransferase [Porphyromonadaceae bacterium]
MKEIIPAVDRNLLKSELTEKSFIRPTNKAHNEIYVIDAHSSPNTMREIGRLRELSFRSWGGGTGEEIDTDEFDFLKKPFKQLIVWDPEEEEIVGGYRYLSGRDVEFFDNGQPNFVMSNLFEFSDNFIKNYLPDSIELGRAFVQPDYQTTKRGMKSLFALDNLWDGLGALVHIESKTKYLIGKVNIYNTYPQLARELLYEYMNLHCPDPDKLIYPKVPITISEESKKIAGVILTEKNAAANYKALQKTIRHIGTTVPPMFNAYIGLTDTLRMFGTMIDKDFGGTYESAIMLTINDLIESKRQRYIDRYIFYLKQKLNERRAARRAAKIAKEKGKS